MNAEEYQQCVASHLLNTHHVDQQRADTWVADHPAYVAAMHSNGIPVELAAEFDSTHGAFGTVDDDIPDRLYTSDEVMEFVDSTIHAFITRMQKTLFNYRMARGKLLVVNGMPRRVRAYENELRRIILEFAEQIRKDT